MSFDWKRLVSSIAPTVSGALEGPLSGLGVSALSEALLGRVDGSEEEVVDALRTFTPAVAAELKKAELQLQERLQELGIDLAEVARRDQTTIRDLSPERDIQSAGTERTSRILAFVVLVGFFVSVAYVFMGGIQPEVAGVAGTLIGYVSAKADTVVAYYFGSSAGSAAKNRMLEQAIGKAVGQESTRAGMSG